jgi:amino acid transporter
MSSFPADLHPLPSTPRNAPCAAAPAPTLPRVLGLSDLVAHGLAYIAPVAPLTLLGFVWQASGGLMGLAYVLGLLCIALTAWSYAVMSREVPSAGSVYGFARASLGHGAGFVAGWMLLLDYLLIPALVFVLMAVPLEAVAPVLGRAGWLVVLAAVTLGLNWWGITVTSRVNKVAVLLQLGFMAALVVLGALALRAGAGTGGLTLKPFYDPAHMNLSVVLAGTGLCMLSYLGFDAVSTLAEEVKGTDRGLVGRATFWVLGICGVVFLLAVWVLGNLMPGLQIQDPANAAIELITARIGEWLVLPAAAVLVLVAGFSNALPMQVGVSRVLFAMARDGQLPRALARLHPRHRTPHVALMLSTVFALSVALAMRHHAVLLASLVNFGALLAFAFLHASVLMRMGVQLRSRRWLAHWLVPGLGAVVVLGVLTGLPRLAQAMGLAWLAIGMGVALWLRRQPAAAVG